MNINTMTDEEILGLDDARVDKIVKLTFAEEGLQIVPKPEEPTYHVIDPMDKTLFKVDGVDVLFEDEATAISVRDTLQNAFSKLRKSNGWGDNAHEEQYYPSYDKSKTTINVTKTIIYSRDLHAKMQGYIEQNKGAKDAYEAALKIYEKARDAGEDYVTTIWAKINGVRAKYAGYETMRARYKEYLILADGAEETAWTFLKKAFAVDEDTEKWVRAKLVEEANQK
ncbi:MAG: hypothetical protein AAB403_03610 [Planctomycetota bacterium]